ADRPRRARGSPRAVDRPRQPRAHDPGQRRRGVRDRGRGEELAVPEQSADRAVLHGRGRERGSLSPVRRFAGQQRVVRALELPVRPLQRRRVVHGGRRRGRVCGAGAKRLERGLGGLAERLRHPGQPEDRPDALRAAVPRDRHRPRARGARVPLQLDRADRGVAAHGKNPYLGANVVFKTTDGGEHWTPVSPDLTRNDKAKQVTSGGPIEYDISGAETYNTILTVNLAPTDTNVLWVGTDDGLVHVTRDGGRTWVNVSGRFPRLPKDAEGRIYQIGVSPFDAGTAYLAVDRHELDDSRPYVYKTADFGRTWTDISRGLPPDVPAHVVREDPN